MFFKILQNSQENTSARVCFLIKLQAWGLQFYLKKRLWHKCFPLSFAKFLRTLFLQNPSDGCFWQNVKIIFFHVFMKFMFVTPNVWNSAKFAKAPCSQKIWEIEYCLYELTKRRDFQSIACSKLTTETLEQGMKYD